MDLLCKAIPARLPVLITGPPGVGKTDIITQAAYYCEHDVVVSHPALSDPTDYKGLAWMDNGSGMAKFLPIGEMNSLLYCQKPTVWIMDDLGQASESVQKALMQWILGRMVGDHRLPDHVTIVAATNRRQDRAGVGGFLAPIRSRFKTIVELEVDNAEWCDWAIQHDIVDNVITFLRSIRPALLSTDDAPSADIVNCPSPRTWSNLSDIERLNLPQHIAIQAYGGAVGKGASTEYVAFCNELANMVSLDAILDNPTTAELPQKPPQCYATATGLASRTNYRNFGTVMTYCDRWYNAGRSEFVSLYFQDTITRDQRNRTDTSKMIVMHPEFLPACKRMKIDALCGIGER